MNSVERRTFLEDARDALARELERSPEAEAWFTSEIDAAIMSWSGLPRWNGRVEAKFAKVASLDAGLRFLPQRNRAIEARIASLDKELDALEGKRPGPECGDSDDA